MSVAGDERAALVRTLRAAALLGIGFPRFADRRHRIEAQIVAGHEWGELVDQLASGPPVYSPLRRLNRVANIHELFVHHEDVRRAVPGWSPGALDNRAIAALRRLTRYFSPVLMPNVPARVTLHTPDGNVLARFGAGPEVTATGTPGELLLFAFGRNEIHVDFTGDADVINSVRRTERRF